MRGLVSPLAHPIFVAAFAVALGTRARRNPLLLLTAFSSGVVLHALWNHAAISGVVTNLAPHTVALNLALTAAALLCTNREATGTAATVDARAPMERSLNETRTDGATVSWYSPLPWYEPVAETPRQVDALRENERPPA